MNSLEIYYEKGMEKGIERGIEKGRTEKEKNIVLNLLEIKTLTISDIANIAEVSESFVKKMRDLKNKNF